MKTAVETFHEHLDECERCRTRPFDLCPVGAQLLTAAGAEATQTGLDKP